MSWLCIELVYSRELGIVWVPGKEHIMLRWAVIFFIVAIIAAIFGFGNISDGATEIAKILFFLFVVLFLVSLILNLMKGKGPKV